MHVVCEGLGVRVTRVLFVNTRSAIGADVAVHISLIQNLDPARCEVYVATNSRAADAAVMERIVSAVPGAKLFKLNLGYELAGLGKFRKPIAVAGNLVALLLGLLRLMAVVWAKRIDVIHSTDRPRDALVSTLLAKLTGRKNLIHFHIKWYPEIGRATAWGLRNCSAVLAISQFARRSLIEGGIPEEKIYTALNATDPDRFDLNRHDPAEMRKRLNLGPEVPLVGIAARIMVWKGHIELVEAMAKVRESIPEAHLVIMGNEDTLASPDSYAAKVRQRIEELGLSENVTWAGWFDDMPRVFAGLEVVAVPSWEEPFGLVVTEAMSMEKPVVGFDSGALPEIVTNGEEGLLVPARDTRRLADAIIELLRDPAKRREMGRKGRAKVIERFTPHRQADEVAGIYERICQGPANEFAAPSDKGQKQIPTG